MEKNAYALHNITPIEGASIFFTSFKSQWLLERGVELATDFRFEKIPRNRFRYSAEESAHSEAFPGLRKSQFRSSERNGITRKKFF